MQAVQVRVEWEGKPPTTVYVPQSIIDEHDPDEDDVVAEYLSDQHGFLVKAWWEVV